MTSCEATHLNRGTTRTGRMRDLVADEQRHISCPIRKRGGERIFPPSADRQHIEVSREHIDTQQGVGSGGCDIRMPLPPLGQMAG
jgi:hypothetical protein